MFGLLESPEPSRTGKSNGNGGLALGMMSGKAKAEVD